jgi:hypothetical protein
VENTFCFPYCLLETSVLSHVLYLQCPDFNGN